MMWYIALLLLPAFTHARYFGNYECSGRSDVIVHLFEWRWDDIGDECERFLGPKEYCGVQISPANEHRVVWEPNWRPWWERYQPVSYILGSRSGDRGAFERMVQRCNAVGVKIFVDVVVNHMCGGGSGTGSAGSHWDRDNENYPGVPYGPDDFNHYPDQCPNPSGDIQNYQNPEEVRNCRLNGMSDLKHGKDYVRGKIRDFFQDLINIGVAGFRIDASKHMWPGDCSAIFDPLNGQPYIFQEVIDQGGEPIKASEYTGIGRVTEFKYGLQLGKVFQLKDGQKLAYLKNFGEGWNFMSSMSAVVFVDNHDNQRGHGGGGDVLTHKNPRLYKAGTAFKLAWDYGHVRLMSSFSFDQRDQGPPSHGDGNTKNVPINDDGTCGDGWVCEHRWRQIFNMVKFHNIAVGKPVANWWDNGNNQIAFSRGNVAFIAFNREDYDMNVDINTGLPPGAYCDVISGGKDGGRCTGKTITVNDGGGANISISSGDGDIMIAIHAESKL